MAPKWLSNHDESGKRMSVFSIINSRKQYIDALPPPVPPPDFAFLESQPESDNGELRERPTSRTSRQRSSSRKRMSFFGRPVATEILSPEELCSDVSLPQSPLREEPAPALPVKDEEAAAEATTTTRRRSSRYFKPRSEYNARWTRRFDREARPATSASDQSPVPEQDFAHHLKKASISAPFNFQHVTHTHQQDLPRAHDTTDNDLAVKFLASAAQQMPQSDLKGIKAESIEDRMSGKLRTPPRSQRHSRPSSSKSDRSPSATVSPTMTANPWQNPRSRGASVASMEPPKHRSPTSPMSRSPSLVSLLAAQRDAPSELHPALRIQALNSEATPAVPESASPAQTPGTDAGRFLDIVPEERENASAPSSPFARGKQPTKQALAFNMPEPMPRKMSIAATEPDSVRSVREMSQGSDLKDSLPSLCSGDSWEEDIDYCYNNEAEATCDFEWTHRLWALVDPHDSVIPPPREKFEEDALVKSSPTPSVSGHVRNKSSMTLAGFFPKIVQQSPRESEDDDADVSCSASEITLPDIPRLSIFKMPLMYDSGVARTSEDCRRLSQHKIADLTVSTEDLRLARRESEVSPTDTSSMALPAWKGHVRSRSGPASPDHPRFLSKHLQRWTFAPSSPTYTTSANDTSPKSRPASTHGHAPSPPPSMPLPPLPQQQQQIQQQQQHQFKQARPYPTPNFSHKRFTTSPSAPSLNECIMMRRPETPEDRTVLQAAGRTVQRERNSRASSLAAVGGVAAAGGRRLSRLQTASQPSLKTLMTVRSQSVPFNVSGELENMPMMEVSNLAEDVGAAGPRTFPAWI